MQKNYKVKTLLTVKESFNKLKQLDSETAVSE